MIRCPSCNCLLGLALVAGLPTAVSAADPLVQYAAAELIGPLEQPQIAESSGLAVSHRFPGLIWTHNDSGDTPRIFAFDLQGKHRGSCRIQGAAAVDWEDMGSFSLHGGHYLFLADVGDNAKKREHCTIYLAAEPESPAGETVARPLPFRYEDGPRDCEAVGLDIERQVFILVEKPASSFRDVLAAPGTACRIYELDWKAEQPGGERVARCIGALPQDPLAIPWITSLDISPDGRTAVMITYGITGHIFRRSADESWRAAFARPPQPIVLPGPSDGRLWGEAVCFGLDGVTLYLTSEKLPCPLFVIRHDI